MNKQDISGWLKELKIGSYLRELSVVIIGVAVTLYVGNAITNMKEKKDLDLQLNAIYNELEENSKRLDPVIEFYHLHENLRNYLYEIIEYPERYNNDSINKYRKVLSYSIGFSYKRAAFDMFVNSGAMKLLTDRKQLLEITESYAILEEFKQGHDAHFALKAQTFSDIYRMDKAQLFGKDYNIMAPEWNIQFNFHALNNGMEELARSVKEELGKVLEKQ